MLMLLTSALGMIFQRLSSYRESRKFPPWKVVKGASHAIHLDKPDEVVTAIRDVFDASRKSSLSSGSIGRSPSSK